MCKVLSYVAHQHGTNGKRVENNGRSGAVGARGEPRAGGKGERKAEAEMQAGVRAEAGVMSRDVGSGAETVWRKGVSLMTPAPSASLAPSAPFTASATVSVERPTPSVLFMRSTSSPSSLSSASQNSVASGAHLDLSSEHLAPAVCNRMSPTPACSTPFAPAADWKKSLRGFQPLPPSEFNGNCSTGTTFWTSCRSYIRYNPEAFPDDATKICWVMSLMTSGHGARWAAREFDREAWNGYFRFPNWRAFSEEFQEFSAPSFRGHHR